MAAASVRAQSEGVAPRLDFVLAGHSALALDGPCQRDYDVVACGGASMLGVHTLVLVRPLDHVAFGPSGALLVRPDEYRGGAGDADSHSVTMWRLALEGRYLFNSHARDGLYVALEGGGVFVSETATLNAVENSVTQSGALLGAGAGYLFALPYELGIALSLRAFYTFMPEEAPDLASQYEAYAWGTIPWIALTLDVLFGFSLVSAR